MQALVGRGHRLWRASEIDDRKPAVAEADRTIDPNPSIVRTAVHELFGHGSDDGRINRLPVESHDTGYSAH
jgi:hypothetical protein